MDKRCQEKLNVIYYGIVNYWKEKEFKDPNSIFYPEKIIETEFKKLCPRAGETTLKILKAIKFSLLEKGKCYYTERELAKHFKVNKKTIHKILKIIAKNLDTEFIKIPTKSVKIKCKSKSHYKCILIPPTLYDKLKLHLELEEFGKCKKNDKNFPNDSLMLEDGGTLKNTQSDSFEKKNNKSNNFNELEDGGTYVQDGGTCLKFTKDFKQLETLPIYNTLYTFLFEKRFVKYKKYVGLSSFLKTPSVFSKNEANPGISEAENAGNNFLFPLSKENTSMKHKLRIKPSLIINFDSYGLKPDKFLKHIELHKDLFNWLTILVKNNVVPKVVQTKMFLQIWNTFNNSRFIKHRINVKSITFKLICIALTYRMWSEKVSIENIEKVIESFNVLSNNQNRLLHTKKLNCLKHFLWNDRSYGQKDYFELSLFDKDHVLSEYYCKQLPPDKSFEIVRKLFGYVFHYNKPEEGKKEFKRYYKLFIDFTNEMIKNHRTKKMCKFGEYDTSLEGFEEYIYSYFCYCYNDIKEYENPKYWKPYNILSLHSDFVLWLSHQKGWEGFMEDKVIEEQEMIEEKPTKKLKKYKLQVKRS